MLVQVLEQFNLKHENYSNHLGSVLRDLFLEGTNSDLILVCEGEDQVQFKVHKFVLRSCSRLFKTLLDDYSNPHDPVPTIYLSGVHPRVMESILQFIYLGEAWTDKANIKELLKVADDLEIKTTGLVVQDDDDNDDDVGDGDGDDDLEIKTAGLVVQNVQDDIVMNYENSKKSEGETFDTMYLIKGSPETQLNERKLEISEDLKQDRSHDEDNDDNGGDDDDDISHDEAVFNKESPGNSFLDVENKMATVEEEEKYNDDNGEGDGDGDVGNVDDVVTVEEIVKKEKKPRQERFKRCKDGNKMGRKAVKVKKDRKIKTFTDTKCAECDAVFTRKVSMVNHYRSEHLGIKYPCNQCDSQFATKTNLRIHIRSQHEGIKYLCDRCDYQTTLKSSLRRHIQSVHEAQASNETGDMFLCDRCDFTSKRKASLQAHIDDIHEGIRYHCDQCSQQFKMKKSLITHMKTIHEGTRYPCPHCSYQATQPANLKIHIESIHEGIKYPCDFCSHKASQKRHLKAHYKRMHSSEKVERREAPNID